MDVLFQDLRYALRSLRRSPGLVAAVVLSLAVGIGANSTVFSLVSAVALRPMPAHQPERLAAIYVSESDGRPYGGASYPEYRDYRDRNTAFSGLAAYTITPLSLNLDGRSQRVMGGIASGNYFQVMGTRAEIGRPLQPSDDVSGAEPVGFLSHAAWRKRLGSDPGVVGRSLLVNGKPVTVVGVGPAEFKGAVMGLTPDLWLPIGMLETARPGGGDDLTNRGGRWLSVLGRLAPGVDVRRAEAQLNTVARQLGREHPATDSGRVITVLPESQARIFPVFRGPVLGFMAMLMIVAGLVLAVACANVAGLLLARGVARRHELGVRLALGAGRVRLVRQLLTESVVLALLGGAAGLLVALWGTDLLQAFKPPLPLDVTLDFRPDGRVLGFTLSVSILAGLLFGLVPALQASRPDVVTTIKNAASSGARHGRLRAALVVAQVSLALLLLVTAGLFVRGMQRARALDPGFEPDRVLAMSFDLRLHGYSVETGRPFYDHLLERVRALPAVRSASLSEHLPLGLGSQSVSLVAEGRPADERPPEVDCDVVATGFFQTLGVPIVQGRDFLPSDREGAQSVVIVNQTLARRFWPGQPALGKRITTDASGSGSWMTVVGVARDGKYRSLGEAPRPYFYLPHSQNYGHEMTLVVRTEGMPREAVAMVQETASSLDPTLPPFEVKTLTEHLGVSLLPARLASSLLGSFGLLALLLAAVGLYGVVAHSVGQRTREIGVRMALGARPADVQALVVGQGMRLALVGMGIGLVAALALTRLASGMLYGLSPTDPATFAGIAALLAAVALLASWIPARRAARLDPIAALRHE
jgi:predicted permease